MGFWGSVPQTDPSLGLTMLQPSAAVLSGGGARGVTRQSRRTPLWGVLGPLLSLCHYRNRFVPTLYCFLQRRGMFSKGSDLYVVYWCLAGEHVAVSQPGSKAIPWLETKAGEKTPRTAPADAVAAAVVGDSARRSARTGRRSPGRAAAVALMNGQGAVLWPGCHARRADGTVLGCLM